MSQKQGRKYTGTENIEEFIERERKSDIEISGRIIREGLSREERINLMRLLDEERYGDGAVEDKIATKKRVHKKDLKRQEKHSKKHPKLRINVSKFKKLPRLNARGKKALAAIGIVLVGGPNLIKVIKGVNREIKKSANNAVVEEILTNDNYSDQNDIPTPGKDIEARNSSETWKNDRVTHVVDFINYENPKLDEIIADFNASGNVGAYEFECGMSGYDYPFTIRSFGDEEIINSMNEYAGEVEITDKMGKMEDLERIIKQVNTYGFYYYTSANTSREAEIEASYIKAFFEKLRKDMPDCDISNTLPFAIDIEENGLEREGELYTDRREELKSQRTDAVLYLIDKLLEYGVIDKEKGVTIYGDLNRMKDKSYVDWNKLFDTLEKKNIRTIKWGTRALESSYNNETIYKSTESMIKSFLDSQKNIEEAKRDYKENYLLEYVGTVHMEQIYLDREIILDNRLQKIDYSITTEDYIKYMMDPSYPAPKYDFFTTLEHAQANFQAVEKNDNFSQNEDRTGNTELNLEDTDER